MEITSTLQNDICILQTNGKLHFQNADLLQETIEPVLKDNPQLKGVVLDFSGVSFIDSYSIGVLAMVARKLKQQSVRFVMCRVQSRLSHIIDMIKIDNFVEVFAELDEALFAARM